MCKLTILQYTQCECNAFDGNSGDGFIVTKSWHNRLTLDRDTVPFKRCTQAKCFALNPSQVHTLEFPRCRNVQVTTIRFTGEVCFRCLMHRRLKERAVASRALRGDIEERRERLNTLFAQRKSFASRYEVSRISAAVEAGPTGELWQSIRISSQFEGERSNEGKDFAATIRDLRATQLKPLKQLEAGWEEVLEKQMACREIKKQRKLRIGSKKASHRKMMESEVVARQARLSLVKEMLAYFNKRVASKESEYTESPPLIDEKTKQEASFEPQPARKFRVARPKKHPLVVSPAHDPPALTLPAQPQRKKSSFFDNFAQRNRKLKNWSSCGYIPSVTISPPSWTKDCTQIFENAEAAVRFHAASTIVSAHKPSKLSADVAEFKPLLRTPPTAPRMMRAPTAPRAMRQASALGRANNSSFPRPVQRSQLSYGTFQGYRAVHGYGVAHGYALSYGYGLEPGFQSVQGYATVRRWW